jgi:Uma2 family endonuclease
MGMPNPEPSYYTAEMVRTLFDLEQQSPRYETVYGELLVTPSPGEPHQRVVTRLVGELYNYLDREPVGQLYVAPADISWNRPDVLVQPDVFVVPLDEARTSDWRRFTLLLAVEVLSPSSARADRFTKRRLYQQQGVPLYWFVNPNEHAVDVWTPEDYFPRVEHESLVWHPDGAAAPFTLSLDELLRPV